MVTTVTGTRFVEVTDHDEQELLCKAGLLRELYKGCWDYMAGGDARDCCEYYKTANRWRDNILRQGNAWKLGVVVED